MGHMGYFSMALGKTEELLDSDGTMVRRPVGDLIIAFIETDWKQWIDRIVSIQQENRKTGDVLRNFKKFYRNMLDELVPVHPLLEVFVIRQVRGLLTHCAQETASIGNRLISKDTLAYIDNLEDEHTNTGMSNGDISVAIALCKQCFEDFCAEADRIWRFVEKVLDESVADQEWNIYQRYAWFRVNEQDYQMSASKAYKQLSLEVQLLVNNRAIDIAKLFNEQQEQEIKTDIAAVGRKRPIVRRWWVADALEALLCLEFDHMVENQIPLRKCAHCGRYFRPHSSASRYCNRPVNGKEGKTCKEVGALSAFQKKVDLDEAKKLYTKVNNRVQMWVRRNNSERTNLRYYEWKDLMAALLEETKAGRLSFDEFKRRIDVKPSEALSAIALSEEEAKRKREWSNKANKQT